MNNAPRIIEETGDFAVVYKPSRMHSAPQKENNSDTLFEWYKAIFPEVYDMMHRLDFETNGLILFAKNEISYNFFKSLQDKGEFVKEYSAGVFINSSGERPAGFPPAPAFSSLDPSKEKPAAIESFFRPYGPGRKLVRPVIEDGKKHREVAADKGRFYRTEITSIDANVFTVQIKRGFRHQIRCHLCWAGFPILNDPLYGTVPASGEPVSCNEVSCATVAQQRKFPAQLALRAHALFFKDPSSGIKREYRMESLLEKEAF